MSEEVSGFEFKPPTIIDTFDDFIDYSFGTLKDVNGNDVRVSISPIYIMFRKLTNFFKDLYESSLVDSKEISFKDMKSFNICLDRDVRQKMLNNSPSTKMIFYGAILGIYIPFLNASIIAKSNQDNSISFYYYSTNIFILYSGYTLIHKGEEFCIKFFRLNARPNGISLYYYIENRFSIYDNDLVDLKTNIDKFLHNEDGSKNNKRVFGYLYKVFESLSEEIAEQYNLNVFYIKTNKEDDE